MYESIVFLVRARCRRKESSRSLSHLVMTCYFLFTRLPKQSNRQGGARARADMGGDLRARSLARAADLPARSFDLARPGVAPPLLSGTVFRRKCALNVRRSFVDRVRAIWKIDRRSLIVLPVYRKPEVVF